MSFINPSLLWFAMGGAIPIIIHLLHRQRFRRVRWAAMEFLLAALKKTQRRLRLENLILLLLRIAIMVLLALAIARPFFEESPIAGLGSTSTHYVLVIDNSYSMGFKKVQKTSLDTAKEAADRILNEKATTEADRFTVILLSEYPEVQLVETNKKEKVREAIAGNDTRGDPGIEISDYGTSIHRTLMTVKEALETPALKYMDKEVYIFTDLQRSSWEPRTEDEARRFHNLLRELSTRRRTRFFLFDAGSEDMDNYAVVSLRVEGKPLVTTRRSTHFAADVFNYSYASRNALPVTLYVDDNPVETKNAFLEAHSLTTVRFRYDFIRPGPHRVEARIEPDFLRADDSRHLALNVRRSVRVYVVDGEFAAGPDAETFFYTLVLDPSGQGRDFQVETTTDTRFTAEDIELEKLDFIVLANVPSLREDQIEQLENFVESGGGLFIALGDRVDPVSYNQLLWKEGKGLLPAKLGEVAGDPSGNNLRRISAARLEHPIFQPFVRANRPAGIYDLIFHQYYRLEGLTKEDEPKILARFDDNFRTPCLVEKPFGQGKVILCSTAIDAEWNAGIPGRPPYFVIMRTLSEYLASRPHSRLNVRIGEPVQILLPRTVRTREFSLETPRKVSLAVSASPLKGTDKWFLVQYPSAAPPPGEGDGPPRNDGVRNSGFYVLNMKEHPKDEPPVAVFAGNRSPDDLSAESLHRCEGNLERISFREIEEKFPDFKCQFLGKKRERSEEIDIRPPSAGFWKHLLFLVLGFLLLESILAWFFGRTKQ